MKHRLTFVLLILFGASPALAQAPSINQVYPPGGRAGTQFRATLTGANLEGVQAVLVSGAGVQARKAEGGSAGAAEIDFQVAPDAEVGMREVRVVTAKGGSNAGRIWVGRYPDLLEKEENDVFAKAQAIEKVPATLNGRADKATDVDCYSFQAGAGETWVFSLVAARYHSSLDGFLSLNDSRGRLITSKMDGFDRDPRLVHTFKTAGRYLLQVRDSMYRGGPGYTYRLSLGRLPVVTRWSPLGGRRGSTVQVALKGINLGGTTTLNAALPADAARDRLRLLPQTSAGPANPVDLLLDDAPEVVEAEPNDSQKTPMRPNGFPLVLSGWIERPGDRDVYAFAAKEKQTVLLDAEARRIGSRLDSVMRVLDATGKELAANDDAVGKDSRLSFTAPAAGEYLVEVRNLTPQGGDEYYYRLKISDPPAADFSLTLSPDNPVVPAGAAVAVTVTANRTGYGGEIPLRVENLPPGVTASPAVFRAGQNTAVFTLSAAPDARPAHALPRVVGTARIGERMVERAAAGREQYQPPLTNNANQAKTRETELVLAAIAPAPPYTLTVTPDAPQVKAGQNLVLTVKVTRQPMYKENVAVTVLGLPPNVTASALTVNGNQAEGKITLTTKGNAPVGAAGLVVQGNAKNVLVAAPAFNIEVQPAK